MSANWVKTSTFSVGVLAGQELMQLGQLGVACPPAMAPASLRTEQARSASCWQVLGQVSDEQGRAEPVEAAACSAARAYWVAGAACARKSSSVWQPDRLRVWLAVYSASLVKEIGGGGGGVAVIIVFGRVSSRAASWVPMGKGRPVSMACR